MSCFAESLQLDQEETPGQSACAEKTEHQRLQARSASSRARRQMSLGQSAPTTRSQLTRSVSLRCSSLASK